LIGFKPKGEKGPMFKKYKENKCNKNMEGKDSKTKPSLRDNMGNSQGKEKE